MDIWNVVTIVVIAVGATGQWFFLLGKLRDLSDQISNDHADEKNLGEASLRHLKTITKWLEDEAIRKLDDLHTWHDKTDPEGVPLWYMRYSVLEAELKEVAKSNADLAAVSKQMTETIASFQRDVKKLAVVLDKLKV